MFLFYSLVGTDVEDILEELVGGTDVVPTQGEELIATIESIVIKLEAVIGNRTVPTLALEAGMNARVRDWSTQVRAMKYWDRGGEGWEGKGRGGQGRAGQEEDGRGMAHHRKMGVVICSVQYLH